VVNRGGKDKRVERREVREEKSATERVTRIDSQVSSLAEEGGACDVLAQEDIGLVRGDNSRFVMGGE
jgi:hypothetical protein